MMMANRAVRSRTVRDRTVRDRTVTVLRRLLDGLLLVLVAVSLGVLVLGRVLPLTGHPTLVVAGPSMEPAIPIGAAVVLDQVAPTDLALSDVVSLRSGPDRAVFTHRIIRLADGDGAIWLETQGDANETPDPSLTPATAVIGRVAVGIPFAGYLLTLYSAPSGILFVISVGLVLLLLGVLLEPRAMALVAPGPSPARPGPDRSPAPVAVPVYERATAREVVRASRERRMRQRRWVTEDRRSPGISA
jgi:signal peptidase I